MPHIDIKLYKGRTDEVKKGIARAVKEALVKETGLEPSIITVSVQDVLPENWETEIEKIPKETFYETEE